MNKQFTNKASNRPIVAPPSLAAQGLEAKYHEGDRVIPPPLDFEKLNSFILDQRMSESFEMLAPYGFQEEAELFIIQFMQEGEQ